QIQVCVTPRCSAAYLVADPFRLQQAVLNLLSNAIKFTPEGGSIWVALERCQAQIEIEVRDTGKGIETEFLPYVFERFRQASDAVRGGLGGLGLGLAIAREIIELHCGPITAYSGGKDKGATFTVRLPLQAPASVTSAKADVLAEIAQTGPGNESYGYG